MNKYYSVYLAKCKRGLYCGITTNPVRRLKQHRGDLKGGAKAVKLLGGVEEMRIICSGLDQSSALKREHNVKSLSKRLKLELYENGVKVNG